MDSRLILADKSSVPLADVDQRLVGIPLYRFFRHDELNAGDFSNWFSPNRRAIEDALWTSGFRPEFLAAWGDRIAFRGTRLSYLPEYLIQTYEGLQWVKQTDGTQSLVTYSRDQGVEQVPQSSGSLPRHGTRIQEIKELETTPEDEIRRLRPQVTEFHEQIARLQSRVGQLYSTLQRVQRSRVYRLIRLLGLWKWFERSMTELRSITS